ncbi:hypothetical protein KC332_g17661 [Hortaea werneckii]|nr:hypothetical protein KC358_g17803 [Hortaea werneckii]KAI6791617.1 hypothetical protein KC350_g17788 [Hortaea werneckii]KAI6897422.1 hypothetical protein KC348_g17745 [Hortaea werneckii]KAI6918534.1 hypothetical protein KC341_g17836 [Hortaea werneckii]KAI6952019.1 hypothetical protein KC321_g17807 [Hortaea werneckii]
MESWYWEPWNEANIGYWNGTEEGFFTLYDYAVESVRRALSGARVRGPEVAGGPEGDWLGKFLNHTVDETNAVTGRKDGSPLDFVSFHAKGAPIYIDSTAWAFEFEDHAYFDGYRVLATKGIDKPILNIFRAFGMLTGRRVASHGSGEIALNTVVNESVVAEPDVGVLAAFNETTDRLAVMVWNYYDDDLPKPDADITLDVTGLTEGAKGGWRH